MRHHLYGILERPPLASRLPDAGVDDRPIHVRRVGAFALLCSLGDVTPPPTPSRLSRHHDVLAAVMKPGPLVPLPYGVSVPSGEMDAWVGERASLIRTGLRAVRGREEMHVRVLSLHFGDGDTARLATVADRVAAATGLTTWRSRTSGRGGNATITLAFLVPRNDVASFLSRIAPVAARAGDVAVVPSGPWPPFTFVPPLHLLPPATPAAQDRVAVPFAV